MNKTDRKISFWNHKILRWEKQRYTSSDSLPTTSSAKFLGNSVQFRMFSAERLLSRTITGRSVLDLGCGSGRFLNLLESSRPAHLYGIDLSEVAIATAKENFPASQYSFVAGSVLDVPFPKVDYVTGLGLLDWLSLSEIGNLFAKLKGTPFLFSISENRRSLMRSLHFFFVMATYGWKARGYTPRYYSVDEISRLAQSHGYSNLHVYRDPRLSFGVLLTSFPLPLSAGDS